MCLEHVFLKVDNVGVEMKGGGSCKGCSRSLTRLIEPNQTRTSCGCLVANQSPWARA